MIYVIAGNAEQFQDWRYRAPDARTHESLYVGEFSVLVGRKFDPTQDTVVYYGTYFLRKDLDVIRERLRIIGWRG